MRFFPILLLLFVAACQTLPDRALLYTYKLTPAMEKKLGCAFRELREGNAAKAKVHAGALIREYKWWVEAHRVNQLAMKALGQTGPMLIQYQGLVARNPCRPEAWYLLGRISYPPTYQAECFQRALALNPTFSRAWGGLAWAQRLLGKSEAARKSLTRAISVGPDNSDFYLTRARANRGKPKLARLDLARAVSLNPGDPAPWLEMVQLGGMFLPSHLAVAIRMEPAGLDTGAAVLQVVRKGLDCATLKYTLEEVCEGLSPAAHMALGRLRAAVGDRVGAVEILQQAKKEAGFLYVQENRFLAHQLFHLGRDAKAVTLLLDWIPQAIKKSLTAGNARSFLQAIAAGKFVTANRLATLLGQAGFMEASGIVARRVHGKKEKLSARVRARLQQGHEVALLESALNDCIRLAVKSNRGWLKGVLDDLRQVSQRLLGRDVVGKPRIISVTGIGSYLDPSGPGLPQFFRQRGRVLFIGCQLQGKPQWLSGRVVEHRRQKLTAGEMTTIVHRWVIEATKRYTGNMGDLAGLAVDQHYLIDLDSIRDWAGSLQARGAKLNDQGLLAQPLPPPRGWQGMAAPGNLSLKCERLGLAQGGPPLTEKLFAIVREHEIGHLVDALRLLPPGDNPLRVARLLLRCGFSAENVQAELERRAQMFALARCDWTYLVLANTTSKLPAGSFATGDTHARGFARLAGQLSVQVNQPDQQNPVAALFRLSPEVIRTAAMELCKQWSMPMVKLEDAPESVEKAVGLPNVP